MRVLQEHPHEVEAVCPAGERETTRAAIMEGMAPSRDADGSYAPPATAWGVLAR